MTVYLSIVASYFACFSCLFLTSRIRDKAEKLGFVDRPDGRRKNHKQPVALGGGAAILAACVVALGMVSYIYADYAGVSKETIPSPFSLMGLACAAVLLCAVGLYDDVYNLRGVVKLIWQLVAASLIVTLGDDLLDRIDRLDILGVTIEIGFLGIPLAMLWIIAAVNSFNLIDGMDGLATTVGLIFSVTIGAMALINGYNLDAIIAFTMAGALLGFLRHNWPPAKIYLGDSGSMLIGVVLGTLALRCQFKEVTTIAVAGPLAIWAIPILDSGAALVRRKLTGRSMYVTDRGHIHHRLLTRGLSNQQALWLIAALCTVTSAGAIATAYYGNAYFGLFSFAFVIAILVGTRIFGHSELLLLNNRLVGFGQMLFQGEAPRSTSVRLQGSLQWEEVWQGLVEAADRFNLVWIRLNLYLPQLHEDFFATWQHRSRSRSERKWSLEIPLFVDNEIVGYLGVAGIQQDGTAARVISDFAELIEPLESQLSAVLTVHQEAELAAEDRDPYETTDFTAESIDESDGTTSGTAADASEAEKTSVTR